MKMNEASRAIAQILEARFGKTEAQALLFGRARVARFDIQFMDIKHMSELCERYRDRLRAQIVSYRMWQQAQDVQGDPLARLYGAAEGAVIHRRISDELKLWIIAHKDYHSMRREYLMKLVGPKMRVEWRRRA